MDLGNNWNNDYFICNILLFLVQSQKQQELQLQLNELNSVIKQNEPQKQDTVKSKQPNKTEIE